MTSRRTLLRLGPPVLAGALLTTTSVGTAVATPSSGPGRGRSTFLASSPSPLVVGHRGASGYRPEHTLASYELAARMGADVIEPDLVITRDGVLVVRHEPEISGTTDVAQRPEFASRRATKVLDGVTLTGWWTEDFTAAELRTLRAVERIPALRPRNTLYDGRFTVPTFREVLELRERLSRELGRTIGVAPETKHPTYFRGLGLPLEPPLVTELRRAGLTSARSPVLVQSFEVSNLVALHRQLDVPLVQLTSATGRPFDFTATGDPRTYADVTSAAGLREVARYATVLGPDKNQVVPRDAAGNLAAPSALVRDAHAAGLAVVPYTFRNENSFLPANLRTSADPAAYGRAFEEYAAFFAAGVDGVFSDNPDTALEARKDFLGGR